MRCHEEDHAVGHALSPGHVLIENNQARDCPMRNRDRGRDNDGFGGGFGGGGGGRGCFNCGQEGHMVSQEVPRLSRMYRCALSPEIAPSLEREAAAAAAATTAVKTDIW